MKVYSLGMNCEVAFQMQRWLGTIESSLFSWVFILNDDLFLKALDNLDDIFRVRHFHKPSSDMFIDEKYQICFHSRHNVKELFDDEWNITNQSLYKETIDELESRIDHLKEKFKKQLVLNEDKVFLRKIWLPDVKFWEQRVQFKHTVEFITNLYKYLKNNAINNKLIIVVDKKHYCKELIALEDDNLKIRAVDFFSPWDNTKDGADNDSWAKIFEEFL